MKTAAMISDAMRGASVEAIVEAIRGLEVETLVRALKAHEHGMEAASTALADVLLDGVLELYEEGATEIDAGDIYESVGEEASELHAAVLGAATRRGLTVTDNT